MKKWIWWLIGLIIAVGAIGAVIYLLNRPSDQLTADNNHTNSNQQSEGKIMGKTLVVYYSAQNHTKHVAEQIARNLEADLFEIVPTEVYTEEDLDWTDSSSRVNREHEDINLREIALENTTVSNWDEYKTVLIGYPIWWGIAAWPVNGFVEANNFSGKTVIPFATSTSSGLGQSGELLEALANGGDWRTGHRFSSNPSDNDIKSWTDSIK